MLNIANIGIVLIFLSVVLTLLPTSPFTAFIDALSSSQLLAHVAYFVPLEQMIAILEGWLVAISAYYAVSLLARWIKLIQ